MKIDWEHMSSAETDRLKAFIARKSKPIGVIWNKLDQLQRMAADTEDVQEIQLIEQELARLSGDFARAAEALRMRREDRS